MNNRPHQIVNAAEPKHSRQHGSFNASLHRMAERNRRLRPQIALLLVLALIFLLVWRAPPQHAFEGLARYAWLHTTLESLCIVVAGMVFGVAWNTYSRERPANILLLACGLLATGVIDFAHTLSYAGMPDFVTPSGPEKAINFWIASRSVFAATLLAVAFRPWSTVLRPSLRYAQLCGSLALAALVIWIGLFHQQILPRTFIPGQGLTPVKIGAEYIIIVLFTVSSIAFLRSSKQTSPYDIPSLFAAAAVSILSELSFTLYSDVTDIFNLLGHVYKVIAYGLIYQAVFVGSVREPFERVVRAEEKTRSASAYARSLIEASPDPLVTISAAGKITDVNKATEEVTGYRRNELIDSDFAVYFTAPDRARAGYQQVLQDGHVRDYPLTIRHRFGRTDEVLYNATIYRDESGQPQGVFAAARVVTELKRAEKARAHLAAIVESSGDGIIGTDRDGNVVSWNAGAERLFGYGAADIVEHPVEMLARPEHRKELADLIARVGAGEIVSNHETTHPGKDGKATYVAMTLSPIRDENRNITGISVVVRDVTEKKHDEMELRRYQNHLKEEVAARTAELQAAYKELESFSYSVSHDLRTPLRAVDGYSRILLEDYGDKLDNEGRRLLNVVRDNTLRMSHLIDDILAFSRMGRLEMAPIRIDMTSLAQAALDDLKQTTAGRDLTVTIGQLPPADGDRNMLRQVFVNLLGNAIKFTRTKSRARIDVSGRIEGDEHIYCVKDNGVGFDMRYADKLFGVFQRLHGVDEFEGTGIGLAIVKRIITRHGGRVWADAVVDEGAVFHFSLPHRVSKHDD